MNNYCQYVCDQSSKNTIREILNHVFYNEFYCDNFINKYEKSDTSLLNITDYIYINCPYIIFTGNKLNFTPFDK